MGKRMIWLSVLIALMFSYLIWKLYEVQIKRHEELFEKARRKYTAVRTTDGKRGEIYDHSGHLLVANTPCYDVCADPSIAGTEEKCREIALFLTGPLEVPAQEIFKKLMNKSIVSKNRDGTESTRPRKFVILKPKVEFELVEKLREKTKNLGYKTIFYRETTKRYYPKKQLLANILGFTTFDHDKTVAVIGLEKFFDTEMRSVQGRIVYERSRDGLPLTYGRSIISHEDQDGWNVFLTIREPLQSILEEELNNVMAKSNPRAAYAVMADPYTGDILAAAQRPTFDPNDRKSIRADAWRNRITEDTYEPGSVMKPIAVSGALDRGIVTPNTRFYCEKGRWLFAGKFLNDSHPMGNLTVSEIIAQSSNIGTAKIAIQMGDQMLYDTLRGFGIGQRTGIPLRPETRGLFPPVKRWSKLSISRISIGQGVSVSPLQLLRAYCMLANGGYPVKLRLVDRFQNPADGTVKKVEVEKTESIFRRKETHREMVAMLKSVTAPGGTARAAAVRGYYVAGKTGTAQKVENRKYSKSKYVASFVGFVPADKPRFVLVVSVDEPKGDYYGGKVAGPVFRAIAERSLKYMNVPPDYDADALDREKKAAQKRKQEMLQRERQLKREAQKKDVKKETKKEDKKEVQKPHSHPEKRKTPARKPKSQPQKKRSSEPPRSKNTVPGYKYITISSSYRR